MIKSGLDNMGLLGPSLELEKQGFGLWIISMKSEHLQRWILRLMSKTYSMSEDKCSFQTNSSISQTSKWIQKDDKIQNSNPDLFIPNPLLFISSFIILHSHFWLSQKKITSKWSILVFYMNYDKRKLSFIPFHPKEV